MNASAKQWLLLISIGFQAGVLAFSLRQVWRAHTRLAWSMVSFAFLLMLARRVGALLALRSPSLRPLMDATQEVNPILISGLFIGALMQLQPTLRRVWEAEKAQLRETESMKEAIQLRDTFLSIASHELKTPLTPLTLRLQALGRASENQPDSAYVQQVRGYVRTASRQIEKLTELINDLLDVSRIESGQFRIDLEELDLADAVRDVTARFDAQALKAGSELSVAAPPALRIRSDALRLEQVISNLVDNAIKYGAGKPIRISLAESAGERVVLTVQDQGIGIPADSTQRIFERFERAVSDRHYGGLGLGLYITRSVVIALGGTVDVSSVPGEGATFRVELPNSHLQ